MLNSKKDLSFHLCLRFFSLSSEEVEYNCGLVVGKQPKKCQKNAKNFANQRVLDMIFIIVSFHNI